MKRAGTVTSAAPWPILVVDDDEDVLQLTTYVLSNMEVDGRGVELTCVRTADAARRRLAEQTFALAVIDVVMETEHAGLELLPALTDDPRHRLTGLVVRTGQAGALPEQKVIQDYRIADYWPKEELTPARMRARVAGLLRGYATARELELEREESDTLLREIHHRVFNNLQIICSLMSMQADGALSGEARAALKEGGLRVRSIALVHQKLYGERGFSRIELSSYVRSLAGTVIQALAPHARVSFDLVPVYATLDTAVPLGLMVNEVLTNAAKYAMAGAPRRSGRPGPGVDLHVALTTDGARTRIAITDAGPGLGGTAGDPSASSLGFRLLHALAGQLDGGLSFDSAPDGLRVTLDWPTDDEGG